MRSCKLLLPLASVLLSLGTPVAFAQASIFEPGAFYHPDVNLGLRSTIAPAGAMALMPFVGYTLHSGRHRIRMPSYSSDCARRWAYYDPASGKAMNDDGEWRSCP
jgi:hypothetical protein